MIHRRKARIFFRRYLWHALTRVRAGARFLNKDNHMNRVTVAPIVVLSAVVLAALTACQKSDDANKAPQPAATSTSSEPATSKPAATAKAMPDRPTEAKDGAYRIVKATIYRSDRSIEILVPEDIDVESNRMIEYKQGSDGNYYYVSLIPQ